MKISYDSLLKDFQILESRLRKKIESPEDLNKLVGQYLHRVAKLEEYKAIEKIQLISECNCVRDLIDDVMDKLFPVGEDLVAWPHLNAFPRNEPIIIPERVNELMGIHRLTQKIQALLIKMNGGIEPEDDPLMPAFYRHGTAYLKGHISIEVYKGNIKQAIQDARRDWYPDNLACQALLAKCKLALMMEPGDLLTLADKMNTLNIDEEIDDLVGHYLDVKQRMENLHQTTMISALNRLAEAIRVKLTTRTDWDAKWQNIAKFLGKKQELIIEDRDQAINKQVLPYLTALREKKDDLDDRKEDAAKEAAEICLLGMEELNKGYVRGHLTLEQYQTQSKTILVTAHDELDKHRGWKQVLINLALAIFSLGIGYLALAAYRGQWFPALSVDTKSKCVLDDVELGLASLAPAA